VQSGVEENLVNDLASLGVCWGSLGNRSERENKYAEVISRFLSVRFLLE
jgi:hypothetical protein